MDVWKIATVVLGVSTAVASGMALDPDPAPATLPIARSTTRLSPPPAPSFAHDEIALDATASDVALVQSLRQIGHEHDVDATDDVATFVADNRRRVAHAAIQALADLGASEALIRAASHHRDWRSWALVEALGRIGDDASLEALVRLGEDRSFDRWHVVHALVATGSPRAIEPLRRIALAEADQNARGTGAANAAVDALLELALPEADALVRHWATDGDLGIRLIALAHFPDPDAPRSQEVLRRALEDEDERVAIAAAASMASGHTLGNELRACLERSDGAALPCARSLIARNDIEGVADFLIRTGLLGELRFELEGSEGGRRLLGELTEHEQSNVRVEALLGLARHGSDEAREALVQEALDAGLSTRQLIGTQLLDMRDARGVELLVGLTVDRSTSSSRSHAMHALASSSLGEARSALRDLARSDSTHVAEEALMALASSGRLDQRDEALLVGAIESEDRAAGALRSLGSLEDMSPRLQSALLSRTGPDDPLAAQALRHLARAMPLREITGLAGDDPELQLTILGSTEETGAEADALLQRALQSTGNRLEMAAELARRGATSGVAGRFLSDLADHGSDEERRVAVNAVRSQASADDLVRWVHDVDPAVRSAALQGAGFRGGPDAVRVAMEAVGDEAAHVRRTAIEMLGYSPSLGGDAVEAVTNALEDEDTNVAFAAARVATTHFGGEATDRVIDLALDSSLEPARRATYARVLLAADVLLDEGVEAQLEAAMEGGGGGAPRVIRLEEISIH